MKSKWIMFWVMGVITVLSAIGGGTGLQLLPLVAFLAMGFLDLKYKKDYSIAIVVLSVFMAIINFFTTPNPSWVDFILWVFVIAVWVK